MFRIDGHRVWAWRKLEQLFAIIDDCSCYPDVGENGEDGVNSRLANTSILVGVVVAWSVAREARRITQTLINPVVNQHDVVV